MPYRVRKPQAERTPKVVIVRHPAFGGCQPLTAWEITSNELRAAAEADPDAARIAMAG